MNHPTPTSINAEEMIQKGLDRWGDCEGLPEMTLLRLGLLRELSQKLHSEKSRCLAAGRKTEVQVIKNWEQQLDKLRELATLEGSLTHLITQSSQRQKRKRILPEALFDNFDREKLLRYDRKWEQCIAAEATSLGWGFWKLDTWVQIALIEEWSIRLSDTLWPHGLVLFMESAHVPESDPLSENEKSDLWRGHWMIILHPNFKNPGELSLNLNRWPGAPQPAPTPPLWKLLYPDY